MSTTASGAGQQPPEPSTTPQAEVGGVPAGAVALENVTLEHRPVKTRHGVARPVFYPAAGLVLLFVVVAVAFPQWLGSVIAAANDVVVNSLGWYYVLIVTGFVIFAIFLALSRLGDIKLGRDEEPPQYRLFSWFAMLFAAGMGIGLVFWGVAEPLNHYASPPPRAQGSPDVLAQGAMTYTFLHWGLHAWAIYIVVGLSVAYVVHRRRRPVSLRWALEPVLGTRRVQGGWGHLVDVVAVVGTMFGVATSLGFGVAQVGAGLDFLGILTLSRTTLVVLIIVIAGLAAISVATGLDAGIKWLSNINLVLAGLLMLLVLSFGPTLFVLREAVQSIGSYLGSLVRLSFATLPYQGVQGESWLASWTTYYWGWWMSWSPFVGIFIARISRGRTVREFIIGVLLVPTLVTFTWFSVLGGTALYRELFGAGGLIAPDGTVNNDTALFQMLAGLPGGPVLSGLAILLIVIFFVTSSDSGSYVVSMLSAGGNPNPELWTRLSWAALSGAIAAVLLGTGGTAGGLASLQTMAILVAAPFSVVMIFMCVGLFRSLQADHERSEEIRRSMVRERLVTAVVGELGGADTPPNWPIESATTARQLRERLIRRPGSPGRRPGPPRE
ncbi:BCCT family transporter [Georgenia thermotolerans]|uniref:BCCT family transporter n=1 Tax=Georgenia thermotolerans TaxID=527326 RepID=A0A7J5USJ0_9MICO|nr:BCCT family transporter [Georgenia thermotolerans]KAE8765422.1 BCCT family transporter [Georgenia thermotolerans]